MTTWTQESNTTASYVIADKSAKGGTIWDSGATVWDVSGNVEQTLWDVSMTSYTEITSSGTVWTPV